MSDQRARNSSSPDRSPAGRRARALTTTLLVGGAVLAGGSAWAASAGTPATVPAPAVEPVAEPVAVDEAALGAFFAAGYTYDDAVALGEAWHVDSFEAKVAAGEVLLAGDELPIAPGSAAPAPGSEPTGEHAAVDAFFSAGYTYDDAVALGAEWEVEPYEAKVAAGEVLLAGDELPFAPGSAAPAPGSPSLEESAAVDAFFAAGYTYDDAVALGAEWEVEPYEAKVAAGLRLLSGGDLPAPGATS
ncbi:hypothetical protein [Kineococcus sp. SYSU DK004]|uniref:hypothetical protein n=1 Tax=Kineococcus sp. SYSU DK004 TaxID=3383125 RepID=UPI003D7EF546